MSTADDNIDLVEKAYASFSAGDLEALGQVMAPDVVHRAPGNNQTSGEHRGQDQVFGFYGKLFELSDGTFKVELMSTEPKGDDQVISRHRGNGTVDGRTYEGDSTIVFTIVDGKATLLDESHDDQAAVDAFWG